MSASDDYAWDSEGTPVPPPERTPVRPETAPESVSFDDIVAGVELEVTGADVMLTVEQRSVVLMVDALAQVAGCLHASPDLVFQLKGAHPEVDVVLAKGPWWYLGSVTEDGDDRLKLLDILTAWSARESGLAVVLGETMSGWLEAHHMPPHIHQWVNLPGIGFINARLGCGPDEDPIYMVIPMEAVNPPNE